MVGLLEQSGETNERDCENKKRAKYFSRLALRNLSLIRLHKEFGLLPRKEGWGNVTEHCLVEAAAAEVIAEKLGLNKDMKEKLVKAAIVHDFYKRREIEGAGKSGNGMAAFDESVAESDEILKRKGVDETVCLVAGSSAHTSLGGMELVVENMDRLDDVGKLRAIFNYLDNVTLNNDLVELDTRINLLESNPRYRRLNEEGREIFNGRTIFQVQRSIAEKIEKWLASNFGLAVQRDLPLFLKRAVEEKIK